MHLSTILLAPGIFAILATATGNVTITTKMQADKEACYLKVDHNGCSGITKDYYTSNVPPTPPKKKNCSQWLIRPALMDMPLEGKGCEGYSLQLHGRETVSFAKGGKKLASCHLGDMINGDSCKLGPVQTGAAAMVM